MRVAADTNVLVYAEGGGDVARRDAALDLLGRIATADLVVPAQVLGELFNVLVRKGGLSRAAARDRITLWRQSCSVCPSTAEVVSTGADLAAAHRMGIWDSVIMASASLAGCRILLSEDMQHGFIWNGVTVVDPFRASRHPLLAAALRSS